MAFFKNIASIRPKLQTLIDVGLAYVRLGQNATTLSGGEAQQRLVVSNAAAQGKPLA